MKPPFFILTSDTKETIPKDTPEGWIEAWLVVPNYGGECFTMCRFLPEGGLPETFNIYTRRHQYVGDGTRRMLCHGDTMENALLTLLVNTNPPLASLLMQPPAGSHVRVIE